MLRAQGLPIRKSTRSAADGAFQLGPLSPGKYIVDARLSVMRVDAAAWSADNPGRRTVDLAPGRDRRDVALVLARPDRELAGTVLDPGGRPLGGATISARPLDGAGRATKDNAAYIAQAEKRYQVSSGADGRFRIAQLPEGSVTILVEHPAFATRRIERVAAGTTDLEFRLTQR